MIISNKKNFIFLHVPKSAGSSIAQSLGRYNDLSTDDVFSDPTLKHETARELKQINESRFGEHVSFCFVRNPWDRVVSWYFYENKHQFGFRNVFPRFEDFVYYLDEAWGYIKLQWNYKIYRVMNDPYVIPLPQIDFVLDSSDQLLVDYVGRFESIQGDFSRLMKILDLNVNLSHQNKTAHNKYQEYYSKKTQGIVERIFQKEIAFWEYRFDNEQKPITHCSNRYLQLEECQLKVEQGKYEEAENLFHEMQKSSLSNLAMKKLAQLYYSWGRYSESLDFGLKIVDCCNEDVDSWSLIMKSAHKLDNQSIFNQALVRIRIYNELRLSSKISKKQLLKSIIKKYV